MLAIEEAVMAAAKLIGKLNINRSLVHYFTATSMWMT